MAEALRRDGHEVQLLDLMYSDEPHDAIRATVAAFSPDLVALSMRNVDSTWMHQPNWTIPWARELVDTLKDATDCPVILGGPGPSLVVH